MSGSGGYYKYHCKYWLTSICRNWVWVNNASCPRCLAVGRASDLAMPGPSRISREVYVPQLKAGMLHYTLMEIIAASDYDSGWMVQQPPTETFPTTTAPATASMTAKDGVSNRRSGISEGRMQHMADGADWTRNANHPE